jgi:hypothetical protein
MIIEEILIDNTEANQRITNLNLNNQIVTIQINTDVNYDKNTNAYIGDTMTCSLWLGDQLAVGGCEVMPMTNINRFVTPAVQLIKLRGYFFVYSPYNTKQPRYEDFGKNGIYKMFYVFFGDYRDSQDLDFTDSEFIKLLKSYF